MVRRRSPRLPSGQQKLLLSYRLENTQVCSGTLTEITFQQSVPLKQSCRLCRTAVHILLHCDQPSATTSSEILGLAEASFDANCRSRLEVRSLGFWSSVSTSEPFLPTPKLWLHPDTPCKELRGLKDIHAAILRDVSEPTESPNYLITFQLFLYLDFCCHGDFQRD